MRKIIIKPSYILIQTVTIVLLLTPFLCRGQEVKPAKLNLSMTLIDSKDNKSSISLANQDVDFSTKKILVKKDENIQELLKRNGIYADGESIEILYILNPNMNLKSIKEGVEIILPLVKINKQLAELKGNYLVAFTLDKKLKQAFIINYKKLLRAANDIQDLNVNTFRAPEDRKNFISSKDAILQDMKWFTLLITQKTRPLSSEMIQQMSDEADLMKSIMVKIKKESYKLTKDDLDSVELIAKDMEARRKTLAEAKGKGGLLSDQCIPVSVNALKNGKAVNNLYVYYVPKALWIDRDKWRQFDRLTSPSVKSIPPANYYIWVVDPSGLSSLSDKMFLEVKNDGSHVTIEKDISIK